MKELAPGTELQKWFNHAWDDPSGERLRAWMGVDKDIFYDESHIAIIPMGYCYPGRAESKGKGKGKGGGGGGDLPPHRECAACGLINCWRGRNTHRNLSRCRTRHRAISRG